MWYLWGGYYVAADPNHAGQESHGRCVEVATDLAAEQEIRWLLIIVKNL